MQNGESMNRMGREPINSLMLKMGIPMILSMMLQAAYNIVDSAFVSNMKENGEAALTALTYAFPVQMLIVAIGIGTGVGANVLLSKSLGQGDKEKVNKVAGNANFLGLVIFAVFLLFGIFGVKLYVGTQVDSGAIEYGMSVDYLRICCCLSFGIVFFSVYEKLLQATGRSALSTTAQVAGAVTNIILDPIMIYGLFGLPKMGVNGAAWATVIGQIVSFVMAFIFHIKYNKEVKNSIKFLKPSKRIISEIYAIGLPAIIAQALMSFMTYGLNIILGKVDKSVVTAYGLYYKIQQFILFAAFGLRDAITPIVSFNHGMGSKKRVNEGIKYGILYILVIMFVGMMVLEIFAGPFAKVFGLSGSTEDICITTIRIVSLSFIFAGANVALQGVFQALNSGLESLVISVCRQFIFVIPVAWVLSLPARDDIDKVWIIWLTFIVAEALSLVIGCVFMKRISRTKIDVLEEQDSSPAEENSSGKEGLYE